MRPATNDGADEPLVVRPKEARRLLRCGPAYLYELIRNGELESYVDGHVRKITMRSIHARIERKLRESPKVIRRVRRATAA